MRASSRIVGRRAKEQRRHGCEGIRRHTLPAALQARLTTALILLALALYAGLPTKNYYWDGVSFALAIEDAPGWSVSLLHPNHLIYNAIGYGLWSCLRTVGVDVRAISVLQALNIFAALVCIWVLHCLLLRSTGSAYLATTLSALFAFASTWWKLATDANAYILAVFALTVTSYLLYASRRSRPVLVGFVHASGMLIHQLSVILFIPAAIHIYRQYGLRDVLRYVVAASGISLSVYYGAFRLSQQDWNGLAFVQWATSHSTEASFSFDLTRNAATSAISYLQLFLGGRFSLLKEFLGPFPFVVMASFVVVFGELLIQFVRHRKDLVLFDRPVALRSAARFPAMWVYAYAIFLFFWLPQNTFYKLFCLPGIILIAAELLAKYSGPCRYRLVLFTAAVALANLALSIFPYSHVEANQPLSFALRMRGQWSDRTVVYYATFSSDNWLMRYFNPATTWKEMKSRDLGAFEGEAVHDVQNGREVWIDTTAADTLAQSTASLDVYCTTVRELVNSKHRIRFALWNPHPGIVKH